MLEEAPELEPRPLRGVKQHDDSSSNTRATRIAQILVLIVLFAAPAMRCIHNAVVGDPDIWWHLSAGDWMLQHHAIPHADPFSATVGGQPWQDYSWLFDLLAARLFQHLGLVGIVSLTATMLLAITASLHHLIRRLQADFSIAVLLTFVIGLSLGHLETPRPWLFTILFFLIEVDILMHVRRTGKLRELAWLPVLFVLWANLHIQFIDGLLVLGLALTESVAARWHQASRTKVSLLWMAIALAASLLATLANPYGWHIYRTAYDLAAQSGVMNKVSELQAVPFRGLPDFLTLAFALAAAGTLARARGIPLFETGLLLFAAVVSFRSQRDVWVMAAAAAAILPSAIPDKEASPATLPFATTIAMLLAMLALPVGFRAMHIDNANLTDVRAHDLPVHAAEFVGQHHLTGSIYNNYDWGGYLIWSLKIPVSIDGRAALYGDPRIDRSFATWNAQPDWTADTQLAKAGIVLGPVKAPLTQLLRLDPRFRLAYEDKLAAVFIARKANPTPPTTLPTSR